MIDLETELRTALDDIAGAVPVSSDAWATSRARLRPRTARRRLNIGLSVAAIVAGTAGIVVGAVLISSHGGSNNTVQIGDSQTVSLTPHRHLAPSQLDAAASILRSRLDELGVSGVEVNATEGDLTATVPKSALGALAATAKTAGVLRFRQALAISTGTPVPSTAAFAATHLAEAPTLSSALQASYNNWNCQQHPNPTHGRDIAADYVIACDPSAGEKYLLAPTALDGSKIANASGNHDSATNSWVVDIHFRPDGATAWQGLTRQAYNVNQGQPTAQCPPTPTTTGCNSVAYVLDGVVRVAPYISQPGGISGGNAEISGRYDRQSASSLVAVIKNPPLPTTFTIAGAKVVLNPSTGAVVSPAATH